MTRYEGADEVKHEQGGLLCKVWEINKYLKLGKY
jgi:hypothetical protein